MFAPFNQTIGARLSPASTESVMKITAPSAIITWAPPWCRLETEPLIVLPALLIPQISLLGGRIVWQPE